MSADMELSSILNRRQQINEALENGQEIKHTFKVVNIYTEFHEFSRKEIKDYQTTFNRYVNICKILKKAKTVMTLPFSRVNIACAIPPISYRFYCVYIYIYMCCAWFFRPTSSSGISSRAGRSIKFLYCVCCACVLMMLKER